MSEELNNELLPAEPVPTKKKSGRWKKGLLIVGCSLLALILIIVLVVVLFAGGKLKLINRGSNWEKLNDQEIEDFLNSETEPVPEDAVVVDPGNIQWGEDINPPAARDGIVNILLIGLDRRAGERYSRTDTIILCTLNKHKNTLTLTSFMRDMYVQIPGYYANRINAAYVFGGTKLLNETMELNFGVHIDANVEVDMAGFIACVDQIGGIDVELTQSEAYYLNNTYRRLNPDKPSPNVTAGLNRLNGELALIHARNRSTGNGDFDRTRRQKTILTAAYNHVKALNLTQINDLLNELLPHLTTDMTDRDILGYTLTMVSLFDDLQVKQSRIPADGACYGAWVNSMSVLIPDLEANRKVLDEIMKVD